MNDLFLLIKNYLFKISEINEYSPNFEMILKPQNISFRDNAVEIYNAARAAGASSSASRTVMRDARSTGPSPGEVMKAARPPVASPGPARVLGIECGGTRSVALLAGPDGYCVRRMEAGICEKRSSTERALIASSISRRSLSDLGR